jgi:hypothetical protein
VDGGVVTGVEFESFIAKSSLAKDRRSRIEVAQWGCAKVGFGEETPGRRPVFDPAQVRIHMPIPLS